MWKYRNKRFLKAEERLLRKGKRMGETKERGWQQRVKGKMGMTKAPHTHVWKCLE
jgi:hypothetical protein